MKQGSKKISFGAMLLIGGWLMLTAGWANAQGGYTLVIAGFDWGPAVQKVILSLDEPVTAVNHQLFRVMAQRSTSFTTVSGDQAIGERRVLFAYVSDNEGLKVDTGQHITLVLEVGPNLPISSPILYVRQNGQGRNQWIDYRLTITDLSGNRVWTEETNRLMPLIDQFDKHGRYTYQESLTMSYAFYKPKEVTGKIPLIIWLHGGGEGGTDPTIPLVANRAANYASPSIQAIFGGAYVLSPQCPGAWMHNAARVSTQGRENDIYNEGLMALIRNFVDNHPDIDRDRIYVGGCSNGGYMSLKLILQHPEYFAAGYISALAYQSQYISDAQIESIKDVPIWFVHAKDDPTTLAEKTVVPVYERLKAAGARQVYFSYYDHVVDLTGFFGGDQYHFNGHWSWIYSHANYCRTDYDGAPVLVDGRPVTIMEWMATMAK